MNATEAEAVARALKGRRNGRSYLCRCPAHDDKTPSLSVGTGRDGRLLLKCFAGCAGADVLAELRRMGILDSREPGKYPGAGTNRSATTMLADPAEEADRQRRIDRAIAIFHEAGGIRGTLGERYLIEHRGITITRNPSAVPYILDRVRWHPDCPVRRGTAPALVAPVTNPATGTVTGIWRVVLDEHGRRTERLGFGDCHGGAVRLDPALDDNEIAIVEGIEDGLAWMQLTGSPAWAALSTSGMASVVLPPRFRKATIVADRDEWKERRNGTRYRPGIDAALKLATRLKEEGRQVRTVYPGSAGTKDANDVLRAGAAS